MLCGNLKSKKIYIYYICIILTILSVFCLLYPTNIVEDCDDIKIVRIMYNPNYNVNSEEITTYVVEENKYNNQEILKCLYKYKEQKTLMKSKGYQMKNMKLDILLNVNGKSKHIVLGNNSYTSESYGGFKRRIINDVELLDELEKIINF